MYMSMTLYYHTRLVSLTYVIPSSSVGKLHGMYESQHSRLPTRDDKDKKRFLGMYLEVVATCT